MKKHYTLPTILLVICLLVAGVTANLVYATTTPGYSGKSEESRINLSINQAGNVQFNGAKFVSLSGLNVSVTILGLPLTLVTDSTTQVVGVSSLSGIASGDTLSGKGKIDQTTGVITALSIRDESQVSQMVTDLQKRIQALLEQLRQLQAEFKGLRY